MSLKFESVFIRIKNAEIPPSLSPENSVQNCDGMTAKRKGCNTIRAKGNAKCFEVKSEGITSLSKCPQLIVTILRDVANPGQRLVAALLDDL